MERVDCIVIGAGVVGLAVARACARAGMETIVLEAAGAIGTDTSSRNSEVVHAGIYYAAGSLKARLCVAGRRTLYAYCQAHRIPHRRTGKLIVATAPDQLPALHGLQAAAAANGVHQLRWLGAAEARALEPELHCEAALLSPVTGIVDSHAFMLALLGDLEDAGGWLALSTPVVAGRAERGAIVLQTGGAQPMAIAAKRVVNSTGLHTAAVARRLRGLTPGSIPALHYAKGNYFALAGKAPFRHLIYPVPVPGGLGTHLTLDLAGQARFGPDVQWVQALDYSVDARRALGFYAAIRRYWPGLPDHSLRPDYAGIRPKLQASGAAQDADFLIQGAAQHGVPGLVNLYGIESPGLTSALAIADTVVQMLSGVP